jgi:hypothetical protein
VPVPPSPARQSRRARSRDWRTAAAACACYLLAAFAVTIRLWRDPASLAVAGNPGDADQMAWFARYAAQAVARLRLPAMITTGMNAPQGISLMWNPSALFLGVLFAPVTLLAGPQASLTAALTLGFAGSALAMFATLRRYGCGTGAAFLAGAAYGFSPALLQSAINHYDLEFAVFPPLIAGAAVSLLSGRVTGRRGVLALGAWLGLLCAAQLLTDEELLLDTAVTVVIITAVLAASRPRAVRARWRDALAGLAAAAATVAVVAGYPLRTQFFGPLRQHGSPFLENFFKNDLEGLVKPSSLELIHSASTAAFAARYQGGLPEYLGYLGWPMLAFLLAAAIACWRLLPVRACAVAFAVLEVFALGGTLLLGGHDHAWLKLPWYWLQGLPLASSVLPDRFSILADGAAAGVLGFALTALWERAGPALASPRRSRAMRLGIAFAACAAVVPLIPRPLPAASTPGVPSGWVTAYRALDLPAGANVLTVPVPTATFTVPLRWYADTGVPAAAVGGYFIGPAWNGHAYVGGNGVSPQAQYLNRLWAASGGAARAGAEGMSGIGLTGPVPARGQALAQFAAWHLGGVLAVTAPGSPLGRYLTALLGSPSAAVGDTLAWRLR